MKASKAHRVKLGSARKQIIRTITQITNMRMNTEKGDKYVTAEGGY